MNKAVIEFSFNEISAIINAICHADSHGFEKKIGDRLKERNDYLIAKVKLFYAEQYKPIPVDKPIANYNGCYGTPVMKKGAVK